MRGDIVDLLCYEADKTLKGVTLFDQYPNVQHTYF